MADRLPLLEECNFYTTLTDSDEFIGRVREFPDLRTRPHKTSLDATDDIITRTRTKLAHLSAAVSRQKQEYRNVR